MVSYQRWTQIVFNVARSMGADTSTEQRNIISAAAEIWNRRKDELDAATVNEARNIARSEITVS